MKKIVTLVLALAIFVFAGGPQRGEEPLEKGLLCCPTGEPFVRCPPICP